MNAPIGRTYTYADHGRYFSKPGSAPAPGKAPKEIEGDKIVGGTAIREHSYGAAKYPDRGYVLRGDTVDLYVDLTPSNGIQIPLLYKLPHSKADQRDIPAKILEHRIKISRELSPTMSIERRLQILQKYAFTEKNLEKYLPLVANGNCKAVKEIRRQAESLANPDTHIKWARIQRYYKGYRGELNPSPTKRRWLRAVYRPVIMWRGAMRTMRNPDEHAAKGSRTFWINVPAGIAVSVIVAAMSLIYLNRDAEKKKNAMLQGMQ
jgi:hypothetical protein